jgi:phospho-N-acetylmuramoyl-pentapeptide-transferase
MIVSTIWLGLIGFIDDYIKVFKKDKEGLAGKFKVIGQVGLGLIIGTTLYFHEGITIKEKIHTSNSVELSEIFGPEKKSIKTTIPFVKNNEFDYSDLVSWMGDYGSAMCLLVFILMVIFIVTAVSNGANMTDGLDGLATGTSAIIGVTLGILAYVSGNVFFADYLNIMYIPDSGELVIYMAAFVGACVGFLWYNSFPAQVFMGDTGSLALGGIIAVFAISIRKELLIPILCGVFLIENLSVILQVSYFKYTKRKFGEGRRIFKMAPLHHHYQKLGMHESKIVTRFWIVGIMLAVITIVTLKLR